MSEMFYNPQHQMYKVKQDSLKIKCGCMNTIHLIQFQMEFLLDIEGIVYPKIKIIYSPSICYKS